MEAIIINGNTEEIAALVLAIQERQQDKYDAIELIYQSFRKAIDDIGEAERATS